MYGVLAIDVQQSVVTEIVSLLINDSSCLIFPDFIIEFWNCCSSKVLFVQIGRKGLSPAFLMTPKIADFSPFDFRFSADAIDTNPVFPPWFCQTLHRNEAQLYIEYSQATSKCNVGDSLATGRVTEAGQVRGETPDKEEYTGPLDWADHFTL
ncbi:hypothetical protein TNCV_3724291 [Trichonephila clavipes]|nr:hypothetical protein TNCV_3724291 [Trichonephila clavipes]